MSNELTLDNSQPVELYEFSSILGVHYYTSDLENWDIGGNLYQSLSGLKRGSIKIGTHNITKDEMKIEAPTTVQVIYDWAFALNPPELDIAIKRIDRSSATPYLIWKGRVYTIEVKDMVAIFKCPTRFVKILEGRLPTINVQPSCNHRLFDDRCGLSRASYLYTRTVSSVGSKLVFFSGASLPATDVGLGPNNDYVGGEVLNVATGETRTITGTNGTGTSLKINYDFSDLEPGDTIEITQGCDHKFDSDYGCQKFSNTDNFGGFPYIPGEDRNIFQVGIVV